MDRALRILNTHGAGHGNDALRPYRKGPAHMELHRALHLISRVSSPGFIYHGCDERDELEEGVTNLVHDIERAERRIQAVRDLHRPVDLTAHTGPRIKPGGEPVPDDTQVCGYCTDPDALGWCEYPCPTIEALNGDA